MAEKTRMVRSTCRMCHGGCQVFVHMRGDRVVKVTGDPKGPASRGYLCPKGAASVELLYHPDRVTYPLRRVGKRGENKWERISWDSALDEIAEQFGNIKRENGSEYLAMGQGTGRPYMDFTLRFANAFGTPNLVGISHICYAPRVHASILTMGRLPVSDIYGFGGEYPSCIIMWGCDITHIGGADEMCGGMFQRALKRARKVIVVDPRRIKPAEDADHWLQLRPGTDGALALAMINTILTEDLVDHEFIRKYTIGYDKLVKHIQTFTPEWACPITRLSAEHIRDAARTYATNIPGCIQWGCAIDMSASNNQTARALLILRAITGNIDRPGSDVFWVPPAHIKHKSVFINPEQAGGHFLPSEKRARKITGGRYPLNPMLHPPSFWKSVVTGDPYRVRGMWIIGTNPLVSTTQSLNAERSLKELLEFTVVSDFFLTPTAQLADLVLPAATWLEQDDVVDIHRIWCVLARRKVAQIGEVRDDREVILQLAKRLDMREAFPWNDYREYLEWLLEESGMNFDEFCERGILIGDMRYYKYKNEGFATASGKVEIYSNALESKGFSPLPVYREPNLSPVSSPEMMKEYPLILTTGSRSRVFFCSEGRQINSLRDANPDPLVEIHPDTAAGVGVREGDWVWIETPENRVRMRVKIFDGIAPDVVNAQHSWWFPEEDPPEYGWKRCSVNLLFGDRAGYDPETGSECLRSSLCRLYPVRDS